MLRTIWRLVEIMLMLLGVLGIAIVAMHVRDGAMRSAVEPPWGVRTVEDFRKWQPRRETALRAEVGGSVYYLVHGERGRMLASGPAGYLFDERGNFVGWTQDTGDGGYLRVGHPGPLRPVPLSTIPTPAPAGR